MEKLKDRTLITNFHVNDLELYKIAMILYKDTKNQGLCIKREAYDNIGNLLSHYMSFHKMNNFGHLSDFWRIYSIILATPKDQRKCLLREFKLNRIIND